MRTTSLAVVLVALWAGSVLSLPVALLVIEAGKTQEISLSDFGSSADPASLFAGYHGEYADGTRQPPMESVDGHLALSLPFAPGQPVKYYLPSVKDLHRLSKVVFTVHTDERIAGSEIRIALFAFGKDGEWFEALSEPMTGGKWQQMEFDVSAVSHDMRPQPGSGNWGPHAKYTCNRFGFKFVSSDTTGVVGIHSLPVQFIHESLPDTATMYGFEVDLSSVPVYEKYEVRFQLSVVPENPFDPDSADIRAEITAPSGDKHEVFGFYYRPYRRYLETEEEFIVPSGPASWAVRFAPVEEGTHEMTIRGSVAGMEISPKTLSFMATPAQTEGFIRVSSRDERMLEFSSGKEFYPIGHSLRSPVDTRMYARFNVNWLPDHGTFKYDTVLDKMATGRENFFEFWISSWFSGLEWTADWKGYQGLGRYNLANCWKVDYILERSRELEMYLNVVIDNHGKYSAYCDDEWQYSPYNVLNGGFLKSPREFWRSEKARDYYRKKVRYIVARWGYSREIAAWELVSELDLTGEGYNDYLEDGAVEWTDIMSKYLHDIDPFKHLVSTHYCFDYRNVNAGISKMKGIDWLVCDGYRLAGDIPSLWQRTVAELAYTYNKPAMVTEFGSSHTGGAMGLLQSELHQGIWAAYMTELAGTPLFWWFEAVEKEDWYFHFRALANFADGETRLGEGMKSVQIQGIRKGISAIGLKHRKKGYFWVYATEVLEAYNARPSKVIRNIELKIKDVEDGMYNVEFWDTFDGKIVNKRLYEAKQGYLTVELPDFAGDLALKFRVEGAK